MTSSNLIWNGGQTATGALGGLTYYGLNGLTYSTPSAGFTYHQQITEEQSREMERIITAAGLQFGAQATKPSKEPVESPSKVAVADPDVDEEYFKLATKLGIKSAKVTRARLEKFLHEECMGLYDYAKVSAYMTQLAGKLGKEWGWKPIRQIDKDRAAPLVQVSNSQWQRDGRLLLETYPHEIPMPVLMAIDKVATAFDDAILFCTDYTDPRPDPFIGVTTPEIYGFDRTILVFEKFSEPAFRG